MLASRRRRPLRASDPPERPPEAQSAPGRARPLPRPGRRQPRTLAGRPRHPHRCHGRTTRRFPRRARDLPRSHVRVRAVRLDRAGLRPPARLAAAQAPPAEITATTFEAVLTFLGADTPAWSPFWLEGKNLASLLERLAPGSKLSAAVWAALASRLGPDPLDLRDRTAELSTLDAALDAFPDSVPPEVRNRVDAWSSLNLLVNHPELRSRPPDALTRHCATVKLSRTALAERVLRRRVAPAAVGKARNGQVAAYATMLKRLYGTADGAFPAALKAADSAIPDDDLRNELKNALFLAIADPADRDSLYRRNARDLSEIAYKPPLAKAPQTGLKKSGRPTRESRFLDRALFLLAGAGLAASVVALLWSLEVLGRPSKPASVKTPPPSKSPEANPSPLRQWTRPM